MNEIILDCDLMRFRNSGLYHYCLNLGNHMQQLAKGKSYQKVKFYVPPAESAAFADPDSVIVEKKHHKFWKPFLKKCRIWHAPFQSGRMLPDKKKNKDIKIILTVHDLNSLHEGRSEEEQKKSIAHTQSLIDQSDAIVCISDFTKNDVLSHCDVYNKSLHVIHNGKNALYAPALVASSYRPKRPFLFGMSYVNRKKNYEVLLSLLRKNDNLELLIAGRLDDPDYIKGMEQKAKAYGVADRFKLLGPVSEAEKSWYLNHCTAFVHPSIAEGFGFPVIEAMTFGKPVFLSNKTALPEIGGDAAFYFSSFDESHMNEVFSNGMQRYGMNGMSEKIRKRGEDFNWEKSAARYIEVYQSLF